MTSATELVYGMFSGQIALNDGRRRWKNFWFALYVPTAMGKISWKLYLVFMTLCTVMAIVAFLFYPARKTLEDVDFLFNQDRTIWTFKDRQARRVGAIFERDMAHGEVLTNLDDKGHTQAIEEIEARRKGECRRP